MEDEIISMSSILLVSTPRSIPRPKLYKDAASFHQVDGGKTPPGGNGWGTGIGAGMNG